MKQAKVVFTGKYHDLIKASLAVAQASEKHYQNIQTSHPTLTITWNLQNGQDVHDYIDIEAIEEADCEVNCLYYI